MRHATVFPANDTGGFVMYAGGVVNHFESLSALRAFVEANNIEARFADDTPTDQSTLKLTKNINHKSIKRCH